MGIVEQFSLEVVMPTNGDHHSARKSPSVGHGRCGTFPYSLYVSPRSVSLLRSFRYVRSGQGEGYRKAAAHTNEKAATNTQGNRRIAVGLPTVLMRAMSRLRGRR